MKKKLLIIICILWGSFTGVMGQSYNSHDVGKLLDFLLQQSAEEDKRNWEQLGLNVEPSQDNIRSWAPYLEFAGLEWKEANGEYRIDYISWNNKKLGGKLDLSGCTAMTNLRVYIGSVITEINLAGCTALEDLDCQTLQLEKLDLTGCSALKAIHCEDNSLTTLDASHCNSLTDLYCSDNQLTSLNVSGLQDLKALHCHRNALSISELPSLSISNYCYYPQTIYHPVAVDAGSTVNLEHMTTTMFDTKISYNGTIVGILNSEKPTFTVPQNWSGEVTLEMTNLTFHKFNTQNPCTYILKVNAVQPPIPPVPPIYHTVTLEVAPGIDLYNLAAGKLPIQDGDYLHLQFRPEDGIATAADVLFLVDGIETAFKDLGGSTYFNYIINPVEQDHSILIAMREYTITLPYVEGATTDPAAGDYSVPYGEPFRFTVGVNDPEGLKVLVNGIELTPDQTGESQYPQFTIDKVTGPITIEIEGAGDPTGNLAPHEPKAKIYAAQGSLIVETSAPSPVRIYTVSGKLIATHIVKDTLSIPLSPGIYLVQVGHETRAEKIVITDER